MPLKKLVIASDFSKHSEFALQRAILLADDRRIPLHFIHVLKKPWTLIIEQLSTNDQQKNSIALVKKVEDNLSALIKKYPTKTRVSLSVLWGRAADEIIQYTDQNKGDLIIAGAHGKFYIHEHVLGTTSSDMVGQGNTPVLLIKKEPTFPYKKILIATDFSDASKKAVEFAFKCFPEAQYQLLHILDIHKSHYLQLDNVPVSESEIDEGKRKDIFEHLEAFLKGCHVKHEQFEKKIMGGYLADTIIHQSKSWHADLLVFGAQGRSKLHYFVLGSVAKRLLQLSEIDMLAVPRTQK